MPVLTSPRRRRELLPPLEALLLGVPLDMRERPGPCYLSHCRPLNLFRQAPYTKARRGSDEEQRVTGAKPADNQATAKTGHALRGQEKPAPHVSEKPARHVCHCEKPIPHACEKPTRHVCEKKASERCVKPTGPDGQSVTEDVWHTSFSMRGYDPDDIDVTVTDDRVHVRAERDVHMLGGASHRAVSRSVPLPKGVTREEVSVWLDLYGVMHVAADTKPQLPGEDATKPQLTTDTDGTRPQEDVPTCWTTPDINKTVDSTPETATSPAPCNEDVEVMDITGEGQSSQSPSEKHTAEVEADAEDVEVMDITQKGQSNQSPSMKHTAVVETDAEDVEVVDITWEGQSNQSPSVKHTEEAKNTADSMDTDEQEAKSGNREEKTTEVKSRDENQPAESTHEPLHPTPENTDTSVQPADAADTLEEPFKVSLDVSGFDPSDLRVQVSGRHLVVSGEHTEDVDGFSAYSHLTRTFPLPPSVDPRDVVSSLSAEGKLSIMARPKAQRDRVIAIETDA